MITRIYTYVYNHGLYLGPGSPSMVERLVQSWWAYASKTSSECCTIKNLATVSVSCINFLTTAKSCIIFLLISFRSSMRVRRITRSLCITRYTIHIMLKFIPMKFCYTCICSLVHAATIPLLSYVFLETVQVR